jgi:carboxyl-terminal processing protease
MSYELPPSNSVADSDSSTSSTPTDETQWTPPAKTGSTSRASSFVAFFLIAAVGGAALFFSGFMLGRLNGQTPGTSDANQELFRPFWDAYNDVSTNYVGTVDPHLLVEGAIQGIFNALGDPYSQYLTEEEYRSSLGGISGEFEGVGIEMTALENGEACTTISATCQLTVTRVLRGSPAVAADLRQGDVLLAVDGKSTIGSTLEQVVPTVRGPKGSTVVLGIERDGTPMDVSVVRDVIQREDVRSEVLADGKVGYLKILGFSSASAADLHEQLRQLIQDEHVQAIVLDLRDDPGGYVDAAHKIASEFVATSSLYWEQAAGEDPIAQQPDPGGVATDASIPVVVLVNGGTASASEIVAGSLQGNHRAQLVGEKTFGKGTIQEFKELPGAGGYRLSVRKWLTPDQTWIHGVGLTPDVEVATPAEPQPNEDPQLDKGIEILLGQLNSPQTSGAPSPAVSPVPSLAPPPTAKPSPINTD